MPLRRYASAEYAVVVCPSVSPSFRLSVTRWYWIPIRLGSRKQCRTIAGQWALEFSGAKDLGEIATGSPLT